MKFLIDNALSPIVAEGLRKEGYDAVHACACPMGLKLYVEPPQAIDILLERSFNF